MQVFDMQVFDISKLYDKKVESWAQKKPGSETALCTIHLKLHSS